MRGFGTFLLTIGLALPLAPAVAAEKAAVIRAGELKEKPFIDAPTSEKLAAGQPVTILTRQGPWAQVEANAKTAGAPKRPASTRWSRAAVVLPGERATAGRYGDARVRARKRRRVQRATHMPSFLVDPGR